MEVISVGMNVMEIVYNLIGPVAMYLSEGFKNNYVPSNVYNMTKRGIQVMKNKHILVFLTWNLFWGLPK